MNALEFEVQRPGNNSRVTVPVTQLVNAGYTGRRQEAVRAHVAELELQGVRPPPAVPMYYHLPMAVLTQESVVEVTGRETSGEVEFVLVGTTAGLVVTVGSDHTDRKCEADDVLWSKQLCANVCARHAWNWSDVAGHWDRLVLRSWARGPGESSEVLYQEGSCEGILPPQHLLDEAIARCALGQSDGLVLFSGTVPMKAPEMIFGGTFRCELEDPVLGRTIGCSYETVTLNQAKLEETS